MSKRSPSELPGMPALADKQRKVEWFIGRLGRVEAKVNSLAEPFDELRENIAFLKGAVVEYLKLLEEENMMLQSRVKSLEAKLDEASKNEAADPIKQRIAEIEKTSTA